MEDPERFIKFDGEESPTEHSESAVEGLGHIGMAAYSAEHSDGGDTPIQPESDTSYESEFGESTVVTQDDFERFAKENPDRFTDANIAGKAWRKLLRLYSVTPGSSYPDNLKWAGGWDLPIPAAHISLVFVSPVEPTDSDYSTSGSFKPPTELQLDSLVKLMDMIGKAVAAKQTKKEKIEVVKGIIGPGVGKATISFLRSFVEAKRSEVEEAENPSPDELGILRSGMKEEMDRHDDAVDDFFYYRARFFEVFKEAVNKSKDVQDFSVAVTEVFMDVTSGSMVREVEVPRVGKPNRKVKQVVGTGELEELAQKCQKFMNKMAGSGGQSESQQ